MSDKPSVESVESAVQGQDEQLSERCLSAPNRHDIDRLWGRFRETDESIKGVRTRVNSLETRVSKLDDRLAEQRIMLLDMTATVRHVDYELSAARGDMTEMKNSQRAMTGTLERFTVDQGVRGQARAESSNFIARILIGIFAALGVISVSAVSLVAMAEEHDISLLQLLVKLFGVSG